MFDLWQPATARFRDDVRPRHLDRGFDERVYLQARLPEDLAPDGNGKNVRSAKEERLWPALLLLVVASVGTFAVLSDFMSTTVNNRVMVGSFLLGWLGIYMLAYHFYWNLRHYPQRMEAYARMHFCPRCGTVTKV